MQPQGGRPKQMRLLTDSWKSYMKKGQALMARLRAATNARCRDLIALLNSDAHRALYNQRQ